MNCMIPIKALQLMTVHGNMELEMSGCFEVAAVSSMPGVAGQPYAAPAPRATAAKTSVFAFFGKCNSFLLYPLQLVAKQNHSEARWLGVRKPRSRCVEFPAQRAGAKKVSKPKKND